jgi:molecular chaperone GrpE (heat shock protein)
MLQTLSFFTNLTNKAMDDRTEALRQLMKLVDISSFQILSDHSGLSRRSIDAIRRGKAADLRYADLAKLAEVLQIELNELIAKFISDPSNLKSSSSQIAALREEYQRLQQKLEHQKQELRSQFERETIQQLESLLLQLPSAAYASLQNPNLLAKNILPLLRPLDALLQKWSVTAIGSVGVEVIYDPQKHQLMEDSDDLEAGNTAIVRYVGYMHGEKLLYRARVSN